VKTFTGISFCSIFIQKTVYHISSESPEFYERYYKEHFDLLFLNTVYNRSKAMSVCVLTGVAQLITATRVLEILHAQTYRWTLIRNQKLGQCDLVYWVYRSSCLYSCAVSWASQPVGCLLLIVIKLVSKLSNASQITDYIKHSTVRYCVTISRLFWDSFISSS